MGEITKQVQIKAPTSKVYSYVVNPRNAPHFISSINSILSGPEGRPNKGDQFRAEATFFGQKRHINLRVDDLVLDRGVRFVLDGDPEAVLVIRLSSDGTAGHANVSLVLDVPSVPTIFLTGLLGGMLGEDLARLKKIMESGG